MKTIYLIRHGKTYANELHLYHGSTDLSLTENGIKELLEKKELYSSIPSDSLFITSGMKRTEETLEVLFGKKEHLIDSRLREMDFGEFEMRSYDELKNDPKYQKWISGNIEENVVPGGESHFMVRDRVKESLSDILKMKEESIVIVAHGGIMYAIMRLLFEKEHKNLYEWQLRPGCAYRITEENGIFKYEIMVDE